MPQIETELRSERKLPAFAQNRNESWQPEKQPHFQEKMRRPFLILPVCLRNILRQFFPGEYRGKLG